MAKAVKRPLLTRGDLLPRMLVEPPGPKSRLYSKKLREIEAPGVNTLYRGADNILWQEAKGANVLDVDGNRYIDLTSGFGVAAIGHRHPRVVDAVRRQSGRLIHGLGDAAGHPLRVELATKLRAVSQIPDAQTYFAISGADAVEIAIKTALLKHPRRRKLVVFEPAYHGLTFGALAASSRAAFKEAFHAHLTPELIRLPFGCKPKQLNSALSDGQVAAVLVEPIVGREGIVFPPDGWLKRLFELCRRAGSLLITDEIFTGFGRTGFDFAAQHDGVTPDLVVCGKALAGGLPIGAVIARADIMAAWKTPGEALHTATFIANPLACASAIATLEVLQEERLGERARGLGKKIKSRIGPWPELFPVLSDVRGRGLLWGLEFVDSKRASLFSQLARRRGVLLLAGGAEGRVAQLVPPLTIAKRQLNDVLDRLEEILHLL